MNTFYYAHEICSVIAMVTIGSAFIVVGQAVINPVHAVLWLIVSFVSAAVYLITAGMTFIGLSYIIVYVGAIAVLFLFVVMMLNIASVDKVTHESVSNMWPVALMIIAAGIIVMVPLTGYVTFMVDLPATIMSVVHSSLWLEQTDTVQAATAHTAGLSGADLGHQVGPVNQIQSLGLTLYSHGALWLIMISVLLLLAMVVPLALAFTGLKSPSRSTRCP